MNNITYLNWNIDTLYGWEYKKKEQDIIGIIKKINEDYVFHQVPIHKISENVYCISPLWDTKDNLSDGGHRRAIAHYRLKKPLKCEVLTQSSPVPDEWMILIQDIKII